VGVDRTIMLTLDKNFLCEGADRIRTSGGPLSRR
jgi:hypothetical protein